MALDTSIYNNLLRPPKSVAEYDAEAMQGQQNRLALQLSRAKMDEHTRGVERSNKLTSMLGNFKSGMSAADQGDALTRGGFIDEGRKVIESGAKANSDQRAAEKAELEGHFKKFELAGQIMNGVKDQASWDRARQQTSQVFGAEAAAQLPAQYDPVLIEEKRLQSMAVKDQLELAWKEKGFNLDVKKFDEQKRANQAHEVDRDAQRAQSERQHNQRMALDGGKGGSGKAPSGYRWTPSGELEAIPGGPAGKTASATEGERKAATLLKRLEGSEKQLTAALAEKPDAATPGLAAQGLRMMGAEALANTVAVSPARQRVEAAQLDMLDAALTLGTGAAYTREQLEGYRKSYFPQIGDADETIKDKQVRLKNVIDAAKIAAGRAAPGGAGAPVAPQPAGAYSDAEKERRYQAWKAKQGK